MARQRLCRSAIYGHATQGPIALANTGPFARELDGHMHLFAHNGNLKTLEQSSPVNSRFFQPVGETDSELAFCLLLDRIRLPESVSGELPSLQARLDTVAEVALALRALGPANFLYADSEALFVHADRRLQPVTGRVSAPALFQLACPAGDRAELLRDEDSLDTATAQRVILLASVPLTNENWLPMSQGEVVAIRGGEILAKVRL